jgi:hypothetical protein
MSSFLDEENKSNETFKFQLGKHVILQIHLGQHVSFKALLVYKCKNDGCRTPNVFLKQIVSNF